MNYTEIVEKTYELVDEIKKSEIFYQYTYYKDLIKKDKEFNDLLDRFNKAKAKFSEVYKYRNYYKGFAEIKNEYQEAKINLMNNKLFKKYKLLEKQIETYLNKIENELKGIVNIKEKYKNISIE